MELTPFVKHMNRRMNCEANTIDYVMNNHVIDWDNEVVSFWLYNQSGQLVGFQQYKWQQPKSHTKGLKPSELKYFTHCKDKVGVFGIDSWHSPHLPLVVVEGVWEQLRMQKHIDTVAALCNNPKHLKNWLACQPRETVAVCQNDKAGHKLAKSCDRAIFLPEGVDTDELDGVQLTKLLTEVRHGVETW